MKNLYTNIFDSVIYNQDKYHSLEKKMYDEYKEQIENLLAEDDITLGLTLNQIADNPFFFNPANQEIYSILIQKLTSGKAFISTYGPTVNSYASNGYKEGWKHTLGCREKFISSVGSHIADKVEYGSVTRRGNRTFLGVSSNIRLSSTNPDNVIINDTEISIDEFLERYDDDTTSKPGAFHASNYEEIDTFTSVSRATEPFYETLRMLNVNIHDPVWKNEKIYRQNQHFIRENKLDLLEVIRVVLENKELVEALMCSTIDKNIGHNKYASILLKVKEFFVSGIVLDITPPITRSKLYEKIDQICDIFIKPGWGVSDKYYANNRRGCYSFIVQLIDFSYNYLNSLFAFGNDQYTFEYVPYRTEYGYYSNIEEIISISENLFEANINYFIYDREGNCIGKYLKIPYAREALSSKENECYITDRNGDRI